MFKFSSSKSQVPSSKVLQVQVCIRSSSSPFLCVCSPSPVKVFVSSLLSGVVDSHKSILSSLYYPPTTKSSCSTVKTWIICNKRGRFLFSISSLCVVFLQRLLVEWMFCSFCTWFPSYWVFSSKLFVFVLPSILHPAQIISLNGSRWQCYCVFLPSSLFKGIVSTTNRLWYCPSCYCVLCWYLYCFLSHCLFGLFGS